MFANIVQFPLSILVFSNDQNDARFYKRLQMFSDLGFSVRWLAYDRNRKRNASNDLLTRLPGAVLGKTYDAAYRQRAWGMTLSMARLLGSKYVPSGIDVIYCINLDNLLLAIMVKIIRRLNCKIVYEVADIQPVLLRKDNVGRTLRAMERWCLKRIDLLVYTSEHFMSEFLVKEQGYRGFSLLLENKIYPTPTTCDQPRQPRPDARDRIVIGWFGQLRCRRTLELIRQLSAELPDRILFLLRGYPNHELREVFDQMVTENANITYGGPYKYPSELPDIYSSVDLCLGFDLCDPGGNSTWCLTNRLYEAGYFGVPLLVEDGSAGGEFVGRIGSGWVLAAPLEDSLKALLSNLEPAEVQAKKIHTAGLPKNLFLLDSDLNRIYSTFAQLGV